MNQGKSAIFKLLKGKALWPPVVVPFGLDPFGWHGERESYREICTYALDNCTLLPKVFPFPNYLSIGEGDISIVSKIYSESDRIKVRKSILKGVSPNLTMEEIQTPEDSSWKIRKRWLEDEEDIDTFINLKNIEPCEPDIEVIEKKTEQLGSYGLPYAEIMDPFSVVSEMFKTDTFYIKLLTDNERILYLLKETSKRIIDSIESLCRKVKSPFILRLIGAEFAVPPFLSREDFLKYDEDFYKKVIAVTGKYGIPAAFHCHGPMKDIMNDVWEWGYSFIEPFEPPPRGNVTIEEALEASSDKSIVFGGIDEVVLNTGTKEEVKNHVDNCLMQAKGKNKPFILSQTATPFFDPINDYVKENYLLYLKLSIEKDSLLSSAKLRL